MKLIIAEKPSVARAICPVVGAKKKENGYIEGNGYIVSWCYGHLVSLLLPNEYSDKWSGKWSFDQLPMVPDTWKFKVPDACQEQFNILKRLLNDSRVDEVVCATDADREGECIFRYVYNLSNSRKPVKRLWVSSLEEDAIAEAMRTLKPMSDYDNLYNAGFCRAKADWLVGMNSSRLFSVRYRTKLNTGRVQTPTLAMIVQRDDEVKNFVPKKFFRAKADCGSFTAETDQIADESVADKVVLATNGKTAVVTNIENSKKMQSPPKLFDLTSLQREANRQFGYTAQQTLDFQQSLYEKKLSTYPRTDSKFITSDMQEATEKLITKLQDLDYNFVKENIPHNVAQCVNDKKVVSHPAILPTEKVTKEAIAELSEGEKNILELQIFRLFTATGSAHEFISTKATLNCNNVDFFATGKEIVENGFKSTEKLFKSSVASADESSNKDDNSKALPELVIGQQFANISVAKTSHLTTPPSLFTEATLLTAMEKAGQTEYDSETEKKGLGTPATRAGIIEGLVKNGYATRKKKQITATEKGVSLIKVVPEEVKSASLTANWETQLQQVERGKYNADDFMKGIVDFVNDICVKYAKDDNSVSFASTNAPLGKCPKCGADVKKGKFGFYCTGKCGMNVAKVYGKVLTEAQLTKLLSGKEITYTSNDKKTRVLPEYVENEYNGKIYYQWKTGR